MTPTQAAPGSLAEAFPRRPSDAVAPRVIAGGWQRLRAPVTPVRKSCFPLGNPAAYFIVTIPTSHAHSSSIRFIPFSANIGCKEWYSITGYKTRNTRLVVPLNLR